MRVDFQFIEARLDALHQSIQLLVREVLACKQRHVSASSAPWYRAATSRHPPRSSRQLDRPVGYTDDVAVVDGIVVRVLGVFDRVVTSPVFVSANALVMFSTFSSSDAVSSALNSAENA